MSTRKLVHKQFNSPIGLYSQQNVKETLNRELKAFGSDGIEIDEQISKPLNLANSAVLRAVEEEDQQLKCDIMNQHMCHERPSRSRERYRAHTPLHLEQLKHIKSQYLSHQHDITIDRDTVLKINRLATRRNLHRRDHSWPPPQQQQRQQQQQMQSEGKGEKQGRIEKRSTSSDNMTVTALHQQQGIATIREKFNSPTRIIEPTAKEVRQERQMQRLLQKHKSMKINNTNTGVPMINIVVNDRHRQSDEIVAIPSQFIKNQHKNTIGNESEREQLVKAQEKPTGELNNVTVIISVANDGNVDNMATPKEKGFSAPETRAADECIGLVEPKRQYYEQLAHVNGTAATTREKKYINKSHSLERGSRKEQLPPLKPRSFSGGTATAAVNLSKSPKLQQQQQRRSIKLATEIKICYDTDKSKEPKREEEQEAEEDNDIYDTVAYEQHDLEHIPLPDIPKNDTPNVKKHTTNNIQHLVPMEVEAASTKTNVVDDACIYLRTVDLQDNTIAFIPAAITIVTTPTEHKMQHWKAPKVLETTSLSSDIQEEKSRQQQQQQEESSVTNKYDELQHSIAEHLRQIDTYMNNAKLALNQCLEGGSSASNETRQTKYDVELWPNMPPHATVAHVLDMETPLQALLKKFGLKVTSDCSTHIAEYAKPKENMPVIEEALAELATISQTVENVELTQPELHIVELKSVPELQQPAQHVLIDEKEQAQQKSLQLEHVADVVANYEQLLAQKQSTTNKIRNVHVVVDENDEKLQVVDSHMTDCVNQQTNAVKSDSFEKEAKLIKSTADISNSKSSNSSGCSSSKTIQSNTQLSLVCDNFDTYQATYEIPSPFSLKRQISWSDANTNANAEHKQNKGLQLSIIADNGAQPQKDFISTGTWQPIISPQHKEYIRQKSIQQVCVTPPTAECNIDFLRDTTTTNEDESLPPEPPIRKYPAALIEPHVPVRAASPFGLNAVENWLSTPEPIISTPPLPPPPASPTTKQDHVYVSQTEGQNVGLLVHSPTPPPPPPPAPPLPTESVISATTKTTEGTETALTYQQLSEQNNIKFGKSVMEVQDDDDAVNALQAQNCNITSHEWNVINRSFDNISPRPYITIEGYKRVAWPPVSEERIVREFTPQPAATAAPASGAAVQPEQYRSSSYDNYHQPQQQQYQPVYQQQQQSGRAQQQYQPPTAPQYQPQVQPAYNNNNSQQYQQPQQQPAYQSHPYNTQQNQANQSSYNSYSQFQQQHQQPRAQSLSQDQVDQTPYVAQALPQDYRGGSPGIIQLRKEAPVNQKPAPVYTSQPAAVSFQGGSNMRGDLKWPPPEYKEAAAKENEERRQLALGPVCRPRKVHRDYSSFFAKNAINSYYPSYKVPPGTQHMLA